MQEHLNKKNNIAVDLGLFTNILLAILKLSGGIFGRSYALIADGINSAADIVYYLSVKILLKAANKPADKEHPYGHRQFENIATIVIGAFIVTTALAIAWQSVDRFIEIMQNTGELKPVLSWTIYIALFTVLLKIALYIFTNRVHKVTGNPAIKALTSDHLNDLFAATGVVVSIIFTRMGFLWVDPIAGALVAVFILKTGIGIILDATHELIDTIPSPVFLTEIKQIALEIEGIYDVSDVGVHRFGTHFVLNMTIDVSGSITVNKGHLISEILEKKLFQEYEDTLKRVNIHYHPVIPQTQVSK
ncbi:MAG: cation diffusion facilitator family transporter [Candidatus Zophobacter franzmannii]|jgi:cation diffusion facilitator family transporter|nr:cation diffusion facilitator family transporter [Candidatus Zophobacter franzmannii]